MADDAQEVIAVRAGERLDTAPLVAYLSERLEGADGPLEVRQFGGGHANLTYLLRFGVAGDLVEYVLRRPPLGPVAKGSHDMHREYRALSKLWRGFDKAPRAYLYCEDPAVIGSDFVVMERRHGVVVRGEIPAVFGGGKDPLANRKLSEVVIDTLAEFHGVDPGALGLEELGKPDGFLERQVQGWTARYERAKTCESETAEEVIRWLAENRPDSETGTLVHNDWKLDNMAVAADDPGCCVAVYDWDMCTLGDPLCDLGTLLGLWSQGGEAMAGSNPMPTQSAGFMTRGEATERYAERSGCDVGAIPYYVVFGTFKMGVVLQQIFFRYHNGQTRDERFAGLGQLATGLYQLAADRRP